MSSYKVCILTAGTGTRMGAYSNSINKAILPVNFKAVISYIVEKFPIDVEFVIAVGHKKETVIDYLSVAHPDRHFTFVEVDKYVGPGTGPGYSLLQCKNQLQSPFIFLAADTMVIEEIPAPDQNWFGIAPVKETEQFCTVKIKNNLICQLDDKIKTDNKFAFIGLAGVKDYDVFFDALEKNVDLTNGEIQVSNGFNKLIEHKLMPIGFTWFDTGTMKGYAETNKNFSGGDKKFDFSKGDEFLYFVDGRVIKFYADQSAVDKKCERAATRLKGLCPDIDGKQGNFYSYKRVEGQTLYTVLNTKIASDFFVWLKRNLWTNEKLSSDQQKEFDTACEAFYIDKTMKRMKLFFDKTGIEDRSNIINGVEIPALKDLLAKVDWKYITKGTPSNFHGDLQFDNVLLGKNESGEQQFTLIDWRQDFGGLTEYGDLYYDLAKLYGGMILSYQLMKDGMFSFDMSGEQMFYNFYTKNDILEAQNVYESFLLENDFDLKKVKMITAIIFLNMAPLHHEPFDGMLFALSRTMLHKLLNQ